MNSETSVGIKDEGEDDFIALTAARLCRLDDDDFSPTISLLLFPQALRKRKSTMRKRRHDDSHNTNSDDGEVFVALFFFFRGLS
jgi:hypothetical protein